MPPKKMRKSKETTSSVDMISNLPDSLLCHILSFLETKQVMKTSILSRRWESLWKYVDILEFVNYYRYNYDGDVPGKMQFAQYVHAFLQLHRAPVIKRMSLYCGHGRGCNVYDVDIWIRTAVSRNIESLEMYFTSFLNVKWPRCLFYSQTLVELTVCCADITNMNIPTAPFFPKLKKLHLEQPIFDTDSLKGFISGCSVLEYFDVECEFELLEGFNISSATLQTFHFTSRRRMLGYHENPKLVLDTPALKFLQIWKRQMLELLVHSSLLSLHEARLCFYFRDYKLPDNTNSDVMLSFLERLSNVAVLWVETRFIRPVKSELRAHFHNLTKLEIKAPQFGLDILRSFMDKSDNLKVITLEKVYQSDDDEEEEEKENVVIWDEPQHVPKCLLSSLRTICIKEYEEPKEVERMIKYVLGNAKILESMEIHTSYTAKNDHEVKFDMLQTIAMFPRASEICELSFL